MIKLNKREQVVFLDERCFLKGSLGEFYCYVALTTYKIVIVDKSNEYGYKDIYCINLKDILEEEGGLALRNCNTDKTLFTENILEIKHKGGKDKIIFRELDRQKEYINAIKEMCNVK